MLKMFLLLLSLWKPDQWHLKRIWVYFVAEETIYGSKENQTMDVELKLVHLDRLKWMLAAD